MRDADRTQITCSCGGKRQAHLSLETTNEMEEQRREHLNWDIAMTRLLKLAVADKTHARQRSIRIWTMWQRRQMFPKLRHCLGPGLAVADPERVVRKRLGATHLDDHGDGSRCNSTRAHPAVSGRTSIELVRSVQQNQTHFLPTF